MMIGLLLGFNGGLFAGALLSHIKPAPMATIWLSGLGLLVGVIFMAATHG